MQRSKPRIPINRHQNRQAILSQSTTDTEGLDRLSMEQKSTDTTSISTSARGHGETVAPVNREMFSPAAQKVPWDKLGVYIAMGVALIAFIWYLASQDSTVKNLTDDTKDLMKRAEETTRFTIESGIRLNNIEQRLSGVEQREKNVGQPNGGPAQTASRHNGKAISPP